MIIIAFQRTILLDKAPHIYGLTQLNRFVKLCCLQTIPKPRHTIKTIPLDKSASTLHGVLRYAGLTNKTHPHIFNRLLCMGWSDESRNTSTNAKPCSLQASLKDDTTDNKLTVKRQDKMPTLRKIKRAANRHTSQRFCTTFNFAQPHPKPTTTRQVSS